MITAKIITDSISPTGARITTFVLKYHRFFHSEVMTHRVFSKNAASSRAIPAAKMIALAKDDPAIPLYWGKNQPGMQANEELSGEKLELAKAKWNESRLSAIGFASELLEVGLHKQIANRILEPYIHITIILTGTNFANMYNLRYDSAAQPEFRALVTEMINEHKVSTPKKLVYGEWHLPFISEKEITELGVEQAKKVSAARCARVSYLNHDGSNSDLEKDIFLHDRLVSAGHMSPTEHQATPNTGWCGNFFGWKQYRKFINNENRSIFRLDDWEIA